MEIKNHFGVYGVCLQEGKLLCIEKTRGPYQNRFDLPGGDCVIIMTGAYNAAKSRI